jgi:hypothetical protein
MISPRGSICDHHVGPSYPLNWVCDACGHVGHLHPGRPNPGLSHCLACLVAELARYVLLAEPSTDPPTTSSPIHLGGGTDDPDEEGGTVLPDNFINH